MSTLGRSTMFSTVLIHAESNRSHLLRYLVTACEAIEVIRDIQHIPHEHELRRLIGAIAPEIVIVDLTNPEALEYARAVHEVAPKTAVIGFGPTLQNALLAEKVGFDALLDAGDGPEALLAAIQATLRNRFNGIEKFLYCFVPAKAGSGCSTVVMNTAAAFIRQGARRVLVMDADLRSGILAIMLGTQTTRGIQSVLSNISTIDRHRLPDFIHQTEGVDYLFSSRSLDSAPPDWSDYFHLLGVARSVYDAILVDLPELINPATYELVRRAARTFIVTTPEIPAMTLARHRFDELNRLKLEQQQLGLLVNRWHRNDPSPEEIGRLVQHDVNHVFPNDYYTVREAILAGTHVRENSRLGSSFSDFAGELLGKPVVKASSIAGKLKSFWGAKEIATA